MHPAFYEQLSQQRSRDLLREAEASRVARARGPVRHPLIGRGLMGVGGHLLRWGARLVDDCDRARLIARGTDLPTLADPRNR